MFRFGTKSLLFVFVLVALWLSTFSGYAAGCDVRASVLLVMLLAAGSAPVETPTSTLKTLASGGSIAVAARSCATAEAATADARPEFYFQKMELSCIFPMIAARMTAAFGQLRPIAGE